MVSRRGAEPQRRHGDSLCGSASLREMPFTDPIHPPYLRIWNEPFTGDDMSHCDETEDARP